MAPPIEEGSLSNLVPDLYRSLHGTQGQVAEECFADGESLATFTKCHNFLSDLGRIRDVLADRPEASCFDVAAQEYQFGLSALLFGNYRHAHGSLRLAFELLLGTIYFSAHEVKLRQWLAGSRDINWSALMDSDKGVFASAFISAFSPNFAELRKSFSGLAAALYRECSEFVHGNPKTHGDLAGSLAFKKDILSGWADKSDGVRLCFLYCCLYRYAPVMTSDMKNALEPIMLGSLGHEAAVQSFFQEEPGV